MTMQPRILKHQPDAGYYTEERCFINELCNSDDDTAVSIAEARVLVDECTRWHRLEGITERYVIITGTGRVEVGDLPAQEVKPGDVVLIPPGCRQRIRNTGHADLVFLAICSPRFEQRLYEDIEPG
jgi:mannose-6-phosphate isomerase-like protein (cupin superfamily)